MYLFSKFTMVITIFLLIFSCAPGPYLSKVNYSEFKDIKAKLKIDVAAYDKLDETLRPVDKANASKSYSKKLPIIKQSIKDDLSNNLLKIVESDNDRVSVSFRKGKNQLVLKVQNVIDPWGFCCRLLDE